MVEDQEAKANQDDWGKDMAIVPERCSESGMIYHPMRKQAPRSCHGDEYDGDDGDLARGVDGEGRHINTDVVSTIGNGHERNGGNASITSNGGAKACGLVRWPAVMAQGDEFPHADQDWKYAQQAKIGIWDHQREQSPGCTHHKQDG